jgi:hypothetical protein
MLLLPAFPFLVQITDSESSDRCLHMEWETHKILIRVDASMEQRRGSGIRGAGGRGRRGVG